MRFEAFSFGSIRIDGVTYTHDVVIDRRQVRKRKKKPSKKFRDAFGHTPLSIEEDIPWKCRRLVIGTGTGRLPVMDEVKQRGKVSAHQIADPADRTGHRGVDGAARQGQRDPTRHVLDANTDFRERLNAFIERLRISCAECSIPNLSVRVTAGRNAIVE
jgi:hypothetical protein